METLTRPQMYRFPLPDGSFSLVPFQTIVVPEYLDPTNPWQVTGRRIVHLIPHETLSETRYINSEVVAVMKLDALITVKSSDLCYGRL
jgi:hypothetical protein